MNASVLIQLGSGDLSVGFPKVSVQIWSADRSLPEQFTGSLPAAPHLTEFYQNWQAIYRHLCDRKPLRTLEDDELEIEQDGITNVSHVSFDTLCHQLSHALNEWLRSRGFLEVEQKLRSRLQPDDQIRVIIGSSDRTLKRLPWHCWSFFQDYPNAEMALSQAEYQRNHPAQRNTDRQQTRILAILGNARGIDLTAEAAFLKSLPKTEVSFLIHPTRETLNAALWDSRGWDLLFFAGHSDSATETGRIYINENATHN
ncbi:MAG TPA: Chase2 sensor protein, partial [Leptolyngbya sp.]|nr:Chase2 sensor protein [Leptolyngbya sp.]